MIPARILEAPGAAELLGKGVYTALPTELPGVFVGGPAVVVTGELPAAAVAALRLDTHGCAVTLLLPQHGARDGRLSTQLRAALRKRTGISVRYGMELEWAAGTSRLEALVLRHVASGRIEACNADALFVLSSTNGSANA
jgi:thioredoxin reductase